MWRCAAASATPLRARPARIRSVTRPFLSFALPLRRHQQHSFCSSSEENDAFSHSCNRDRTNWEHFNERGTGARKFSEPEKQYARRTFKVQQKEDRKADSDAVSSFIKRGQSNRVRFNQGSERSSKPRSKTRNRGGSFSWDNDKESTKGSQWWNTPNPRWDSVSKKPTGAVELFIRGLPVDTSPVELALAFAAFGEVVSACVPVTIGAWDKTFHQSSHNDNANSALFNTNNESNFSTTIGALAGHKATGSDVDVPRRQVGIVRFADEASAVKAQSRMDLAIFGGCTINCKLQNAKAADSNWSSQGR